jgi:ABC-type ATPase involved in cell division
MALIELSDYVLAPIGIGNGLKEFNFSLSMGNICAIQTDSPDDAHLFLKAVATLEYPLKGVYRFMGQRLDFSVYNNLLSIKKKIAYIAPDSAMISNRTVRENLLFMRSAFGDSLYFELDQKTLRWCRLFNLQDKLDMRPAMLNRQDVQIAITIREFAKSPKILLLERPEDLIRHSKFPVFIEILDDMVLSGLPVIFISYDKDFIKKFSNRTIRIAGGTLT